jgi:hypothetical protein
MPQLGKVNTNVGLKKIVEGAYLVHLSSADAVLLDGGPELALVDAGFPDKASLVFDAIRQLGRTTRDLRHLIFTRSSRPHWQRDGTRSGNRRDHLHARAGRPFRRSWWPLPPHEPGPGLVAEDRLPLRVASAGVYGTGSESLHGRWRNAANRRRAACRPHPRSLRGASRLPLAGRAITDRRRRGHEHPGGRRSSWI